MDAKPCIQCQSHFDAGDYTGVWGFGGRTTWGEGEGRQGRILGWGGGATSPAENTVFKTWGFTRDFIPPVAKLHWP